MSRRKRASMREGPLADLFRSTSDDEASEASTAGPDAASGGPAGGGGASVLGPPESAPPAGDTSESPTRESVEHRHEETPPERLKRVFSEDPAQRREIEPIVETPRYGREEPAYEPPGSGEPHQPVIRVVGVGGGGVNAVNRMVEARIPGVEFMAVNTDLQSLQLCVADVTVTSAKSRRAASAPAPTPSWVTAPPSRSRTRSSAC